MSNLFFCDPNLKVCYFICNHNWNLKLLHNIVLGLVNVTCGIPIPFISTSDKFIWPYNSPGLVTVNSTNKLFSSNSQNTLAMPLNWSQDYNLQWKYTWSLNCSPKIKHFLWAFIRDKLPPKDNLASKVSSIPSHCPFCASHIETRDRLFFLCPIVGIIWNIISNSYHLQFLDLPCTLSWIWVFLKSIHGQDKI